MILRLLHSGERCICTWDNDNWILFFPVPDISHTTSCGNWWGIDDTYQKGVDSAEVDSEGEHLQTAHQLVI